MKDRYIMKKLAIGMVAIFLLATVTPIALGSSNDPPATYEEVHQMIVTFPDDPTLEPTVADTTTTIGTPPNGLSSNEMRDLLISYINSLTDTSQVVTEVAKIGAISNINPVEFSTAVDISQISQISQIEVSSSFGNSGQGGMRSIVPVNIGEGTSHYAEFKIPWGEAFASSTNPPTTIATMSATTGTGRAYARCIPNTLTGASCGDNVYAPNKAARWMKMGIGLKTSATFVYKSPSAVTIAMYNGGGAHASIFLKVDEYTPVGQYVQSYTKEVLGYTGTTSGKSYSLDNFGFKFNLRFLYLYRFSMYAACNANSGGSPESGSYADMNPVQFSKLWLVY